MSTVEVAHGKKIDLNFIQNFTCEIWGSHRGGYVGKSYSRK
jgi:hypothetical protein